MPGEHNRLNAAAARAALERAGVATTVAESALARFAGVGRRFELVGERGGVTVYDDYGHNPTELRATLATARERTAGNLIAVYQPHVYERTRHLAHELADALGHADAAIVTEVTGARDEPRDGVSGRDRARAPAVARAGGLGAGARRRNVPRVAHGAAGRRDRHLRRGGAVADRACDRGRSTRVTVSIAEDVSLDRWTTIGTGGPARLFAQPSTLPELEEALAHAERAGLAPVVIGLGSNVLCADDGVDALVLRLTGELAAARADGDLLLAGGGATNAVCLHRAREAGLGGFEFACAIPGTAGGGVRMNAGAYGSDWAAILERALVVTGDGAGWLTAAELGLTYRHSDLGPGQIVAGVEYRLRPRPPAEIKVRCRRARGAPQGDATDDEADVRLRLEEPAGEAGGRSDARALRTQGAPRRRRRRLADARELHRERRWGDDRGLPGADGRVATPCP